MGRVVRQLQHGWNIFKKPNQPELAGAMTMSPRASRPTRGYFSDRSIIGSIYNRMAIDLSGIEFMHTKNDLSSNVPLEVVRDPLHECLTVESNIDQHAQALKHDAAMTMFEQGHCVIAPVDATMDPMESGSYDIKSLRVGRVVGWAARWVTIELYDDRETDDEGRPVNGGLRKQITVRKQDVAIIENPFYTVMNEPNGLLQRMIKNYTYLDTINEAAASGRLDMLVQLPYNTRVETRQIQAEKRRKELYDQLKDSELGIGYIDINEKIIQLNRPIENKLLEQIEDLGNKVFAELGLTPEIMNNTASRDVMNTYYDRTIEPVANALALEMKRKFLTKTARSQGHSIEIYRDPLKTISLSELPEVTDKLLRNAAITANELRPKIGFFPSKDPRANELANPNMPVSDQPGGSPPAPDPTPPEGVTNDQGLSGNAQAGVG